MGLPISDPCDRNFIRSVPATATCARRSEHWVLAATIIASAVALGGFVMHGNPLNMYNHGFYNLNPTWYHDFYEANGFTVESAHIVLDAVSEAPRVAAAPAFKRFWGIPDDATLLVIARRKTVTELKWPVQNKYRNNPTLGG